MREILVSFQVSTNQSSWLTISQRCKPKKSKGSGQMPSSDPDDLINHPLANLINSTQKCFDLLCRQKNAFICFVDKQVLSFIFRLRDLLDHLYDQIVHCREIIIRGKRANWYLIFFFLYRLARMLEFVCVFTTTKNIGIISYIIFQ